jgi:hypothetical protein
MNCRSLLPLTTLLLGACAVDDSGSRPPAICDRFSVTFATLDANGQQRSSFAPGQEVRLLARVSNNSPQSQTLTIANGCPQVNFAVDNASGQTVWHSLANVACTQALRSDTYAAGETRSFSATWNQLRDDNTAAPPGNYTARAIDSSDCRDVFSRQLPLTIQ